MRLSLIRGARAVAGYTVCFLVILSLFVPASAAFAAGPQGRLPGEGAALSPGLGEPVLPLSFSPLPDVRASGPTYRAQGTPGEFVFDRTGYALTMSPGRGGRAQEPVRVSMQFEGQERAVLQPAEPLADIAHDLRGEDPSRWRTGVPTYGALIYRGLYPGIDLEYKGLPGRFKGTYTVAPGADPGQIRWRFEGAAAVELRRETGELWVRLPGQPFSSEYLVEGAPLAWQEIGSRKVVVLARYGIDRDGKISYLLGEYDAGLPLIIDPFVSYATLTGSGGANEGRAIADQSGNVYVAGTSRSTDFMAAGASQPK